MKMTYKEAMEKCFEKNAYTRERLHGFPHITKDGQWLQNQDGHWTGGFWVGMLWIESICRSNPEMSDEAHRWATKLYCRAEDVSTHDLGFLFGPSCIFGARATGCADFWPLIKAGSANLQAQWVPETGLIRAWGESGYEGISIVDTIMNLPLIWIVGEAEGDERAKDFALSVAKQIEKYAIRQDGSTFHVIKWDRAFHISGGTHQGFSDTSCWSRGQAWALYGFANMFRYTREPSFLASAEKTAEYFWQHLNGDGLPAWDFVFQGRDVPIDASAASIAASGMALLASLYREASNCELAEKWEKRSACILSAEIDRCLYTRADCFGLIEHVTVDFPRQSGVDESSMYGDYYFMEALYRHIYCGNDEKIGLLY